MINLPPKYYISKDCPYILIVIEDKFYSSTPATVTTGLLTKTFITEKNVTPVTRNGIDMLNVILYRHNFGLINTEYLESVFIWNKSFEINHKEYRYIMVVRAEDIEMYMTSF